MKKALSVTLAISLLLSVLLCVPVNIAAKSAQKPIVNNYDESNVSYINEGTFSADNGADDLQVYSSRTVNGNVTIDKFANIMAEMNNETYGDTNGYSVRFGPSQNGVTYCARYNYVWIYDSNDPNLKVFTPNANSAYTISLNWRNDKDRSSDNKEMKLVLAQSDQEDGVNGVNLKTNRENVLADLVTLAANGSPTDGWQTVNATFTTGATVKPLLLALYSNTDWYGAADLYIDNIVITEIPNDAAYSYIDFEGAQKTYQDEHIVGQYTNTKEENGNTVINITRLKGINTYDNTWNLGYPAAFMISNNSGTRANYYNKDDILTISFKMKKNTAISADTNGFYVAMTFLDSVPSSELSGQVRSYVNNGKTLTVAHVETNDADEDWVEYTSEITVPTSGFAAFMLYKDTWVANCDISIDDISIRRKVILNSDVLNTFEGDQKIYQDEHIVGQYTNTKEEDGNTVINITRLKGINTYDDTWNLGYPAAFIISNNSGTGANYYNKDDVLTVSFKMKKNTAISADTNGFYVAMTFLDSVSTLSGQVRAYVNNGKTLTLAHVETNDADEDWVTYTSEITVPASGFAAFMLYKDTWFVNCDISIDNISVKYALPEGFVTEFGDWKYNSTYDSVFLNSSADMDYILNYSCTEFLKHTVDFNATLPQNGKTTVFSFNVGNGLVGEYLPVTVTLAAADCTLTVDGTSTKIATFTAADSDCDFSFEIEKQSIIVTVNEEEDTIDISNAAWVHGTDFKDLTITANGTSGCVISGFNNTDNRIANDINGDDVVNILDLICLKKCAANIYNFTDYSDLNNSGELDAADLTMLKTALLAK